ncbi:ABC transporter substrate-binding protein [Paralimibaculum aggregatum]|uniref:ABC transporter substrate-binding protein n=1 Tax=Paralimibaculum aggregatum TaxID=3036245 RepID=A0ABQ6LSH8_9RHOB|nr:ABC transporter substrate-binding protein [Limibaculum sp. NKW23]GMG85023.1 ABC transporter substrate-binding protein [Limibaculum sp. NKW23]
MFRPLDAYRHRLGSIALAAMLAVVPLTHPPAADAAEGGTVVVAMQSEPPTLTSAFNPAGFAGVVSTKVLEGLLTYDFDLTPQPSLAESWELSDDGLTYTFNLRKGVRWHDGEPFTAADVVFSLNEVWRELNPRGRTIFAKVTDVSAPDDHTVVITVSEPSPAIMKSLSSYGAQVLPEHIYAGTDITANPANDAPIGTGPYKFVEWQRGDYTRYARNDDYWAEGKPHLDELVFRYINDAGSRAAAMEAGEAQLATFNPVPLNDVERLRETGFLEVETRGYEYLSPIFLIEFNQRGEYLGNRDVRRALAMAVNKDFIVDVVWYGYGKVANSPVPSTHGDLHVASDGYGFDVGAANALLDEAGFPRGDDGMRFSLSIDYSPYAETIPRTAEYLRQAWKAVGVDLVLRSQDIPTLLRRVFTDYDFDMHLNFYYAMPDPTIGVQRLYWSKNIRKGVPFANAHGYSDPRMDEVLEAAQFENDPAVRKELYAEMQAIAHRDMPVLQLFEMKFVTLANVKVTGHTVGAEGPYGSWADLELVD